MRVAGNRRILPVALEPLDWTQSSSYTNEGDASFKPETRVGPSRFISTALIFLYLRQSCTSRSVGSGVCNSSLLAVSFDGSVFIHEFHGTDGPCRTSGQA